VSEIRISVAWAGVAVGDEIALTLAEPVTVQSALDAACVQVPAVADSLAGMSAVGVWGKVRAPDYVLRDGDRVEIYRALRANPKDARRANAQRTPRKTRKM